MVLPDRFKKKVRPKVISRPVKVYYEPIIIKAIVLLVKEQLNLLRAQHSLPALTNADILSAVRDKIRQLVQEMPAEPDLTPRWFEDIK